MRGSLPQWEGEVLSNSDDDRLWEIQQRLRLLASFINLSASPILELSVEVDAIINRLMGLQSVETK